MAIIPSTKYSGQTTTGDPGYPDGKAKNVTVSGDGTGTPLEADWVNDLWGFLQALLDRAGITASGNPDKVGTSDYLDSLSQWIGDANDHAQGGFAIQTAEFWKEVYIGATYNDIVSMAMSDDGLRMYIGDSMGGGNALIVEYTLSTAHDVTTASVTDTLDVQSYATQPSGLYLKPDGTSLFMLCLAEDEVRRIDMSSAYDLTTASITTDFYDYSAVGGSGSTGLEFSPDGLSWFSHDVIGQRFFEYASGSAWTVVGSTYTGAWDTSTEMSAGESGHLRFDTVGRKLCFGEYDIGSVNVREYATEFAWNLAGAAGKHVRATDFGGYNATHKLKGFCFSSGGKYMHLALEDGYIQTFYTGITR